MSKPAEVSRTKPFNGEREGAERAHVEAMAAHCTLCGAPAAVALRVFVQRADLRTDHLAALSINSAHMGKLPVRKDREGRLWVRVSQTWACRACQPLAERAAARAPSYAYVDIDRGPDPDRFVASVG